MKTIETKIDEALNDSENFDEFIENHYQLLKEYFCLKHEEDLDELAQELWTEFCFDNTPPK